MKEIVCQGLVGSCGDKILSLLGGFSAGIGWILYGKGGHHVNKLFMQRTEQPPTSSLEMLFPF